MKSIIIEDEPLVCDYLKSLIAKLPESIEIIAELDTVSAAVRWFKENSAPDFAFMDIRLADGLSFDIFEQCNVSCPVIFTTAYDEYAIRAFKVHSIDYLLKPVNIDALKNAISKFKNLHQSNIGFFNNELVPTLKSDIKTGFKSRFVVKVGEHLRLIAVEQIAYFLSQGKATWICTFDGRKYPLEQSIDAISDAVNPNLFFRINRQNLVAISAIEDVIVFSGSRLQVKIPHCVDDHAIVSRERVADLKKWMEG